LEPKPRVEVDGPDPLNGRYPWTWRVWWTPTKFTSGVAATEDAARQAGVTRSQSPPVLRADTDGRLRGNIRVG
jgi:hypothetical protein